jgi:hypothetical protein
MSLENPGVGRRLEVFITMRRAVDPVEPLWHVADILQSVVTSSTATSTGIATHQIADVQGS